MTTLSILVPHYNDPDGLRLSLASIAAQTWQGSRTVVVCDDGSTPQALAAAEAVLAESREHSVLLRNAQNRGRPYTRNVLLDAAEGKYSAWLDSGDEWYSRKIERQLDRLYRWRLKMGDEAAVWCTCNFDWQWAGGKPRVRTQRLRGDQATNLLVGTLGAYLWTTFARTRDFRDVGYFDARLPRLQDLDFFLRFLQKGGLLVAPDASEPLAVYHKSDIGRDGQQILQCFDYVFKKHAPLMMQRSRRFRRNRRLAMYMHAARFTLNNAEHLKTARFLATAAAIHPIGFVGRMIRSKGRL